MEDCTLNYVPEHLHARDREPIEEFFVGEHLFRRCTPEQCAAPFEKQKLYDLSINREGNPVQPISGSDDVLWNCDGAADVGERYNMLVAHYRICELQAGQYRKPVSVVRPDGNGTPETISCTITLKHDVRACNYAHAVFEFLVDDVVVTESNYTTTLGRGGKRWSNLRNECKQEIERMRATGEVWINWPAAAA